ncbi:hypothetical protein M422DRAFT_242179 [Sphaerobolus stellatus SS14]|nr:hypothetical protein M422DRAFT_242179 [Sphaerobolus stellatus SS14]
MRERLLAGNFAKNGCQIPDSFEGDPISAEIPSDQFDRPKCLEAHSVAITRTSVDRVIEGLKARGITILGAVGYCYGVRHAVDLAIENTIASAVMPHPSFIVPDGDFPTLLEKSNVPLLIQACDFDTAFPAETAQKTDDILGNGKHAAGYKREHFLGCTHGLGSDHLVKAGEESAFKYTVEWFSKL